MPKLSSGAAAVLQVPMAQRVLGAYNVIAQTKTAPPAPLPGYLWYEAGVIWQMQDKNDTGGVPIAFDSIADFASCMQANLGPPVTIGQGRGPYGGGFQVATFCPLNATVGYVIAAAPASANVVSTFISGFLGWPPSNAGACGLTIPAALLPTSRSTRSAGQRRPRRTWSSSASAGRCHPPTPTRMRGFG